MTSPEQGHKSQIVYGGKENDCIFIMGVKGLKVVRVVTLGFDLLTLDFHNEH